MRPRRTFVVIAFLIAVFSSSIGQGQPDYSKMVQERIYANIVAMKAIPNTNSVICVEQETRRVLVFDTDRGCFVKGVAISSGVYRPSRSESTNEDLYQVFMDEGRGVAYVNNATSGIVDVVDLGTIEVVASWKFTKSFIILDISTDGHVHCRSLSGTHLYVIDPDDGIISGIYEIESDSPFDYRFTGDGEVVVGYSLNPMTFERVLAQWKWNGHAFVERKSIVDLKNDTKYPIATDDLHGRVYIRDQNGSFAYDLFAKRWMSEFDLDIRLNISSLVRGVLFDYVNDRIISVWSDRETPYDFVVQERGTGEIIEYIQTPYKKSTPIAYAEVTKNGRILFYNKRKTGSLFLDEPHLGVVGLDTISVATDIGEDLSLFHDQFYDDNDHQANPGDRFNVVLDVQRNVRDLLVGALEVGITSGNGVIVDYEDVVFEEGEAFKKGITIGVQVNSGEVAGEMLRMTFTMNGYSAEYLIPIVENVSQSVSEISAGSSPILTDLNREYIYYVTETENMPGQIIALDVEAGKIVARSTVFSGEGGYSDVKVLKMDPGGRFLYFFRPGQRKIHKLSLPYFDEETIVTLQFDISSFEISPDNELYVQVPFNERQFGSSSLYKIDEHSGMVVGSVAVNEPDYAASLKSSHDGKIIVAFRSGNEFWVYRWNDVSRTYEQANAFYNNNYFDYVGGRLVIDSDKNMLYSVREGPIDGSTTNCIQRIDLLTGEQYDQKLGEFLTWKRRDFDHAWGDFDRQRKRGFKPEFLSLDKSRNSLVCLIDDPSELYRKCIVYIDRDDFEITHWYTLDGNDRTNVARGIATTPGGVTIINRNYLEVLHGDKPLLDERPFQRDVVACYNAFPIVKTGTHVDLVVESEHFPPPVTTGVVSYDWSVVSGPSENVAPLIGGGTILFYTEGTYLLEMTASLDGDKFSVVKEFYVYDEFPSVTISTESEIVDAYNGEQLLLTLRLSEGMPFCVPFSDWTEEMTFNWDLERRWFDVGETTRRIENRWDGYSLYYYPFTQSGIEAKYGFSLLPPFDILSNGGTVDVEIRYPLRDDFVAWMTYFYPDVSVEDSYHEDFDGDGNTNFYEFVTGSDPSVTDGNPLLTYHFEKIDGFYYPILTRNEFGFDSLYSYRIECSRDLINWFTPYTYAVGSVLNPNSVVLIESSVSFVDHPIFSGSPVFFRTVLVKKE